MLADGANVIVHLSPSPVVAKVAASTRQVRADPGAWLQRELDVAGWLHGAAIPVAEPSPEVPATVHHGDGQVMSFWRYLPPAGDRRPDEGTFGSMLRDLHLALRAYPKPDRHRPRRRWPRCRTSRPSWPARRPRCPPKARPPWPPRTRG